MRVPKKYSVFHLNNHTYDFSRFCEKIFLRDFSAQVFLLTRAFYLQACIMIMNMNHNKGTGKYQSFANIDIKLFVLWIECN